jgi:hypothetical protein
MQAEINPASAAVRETVEERSRFRFRPTPVPAAAWAVLLCLAVTQAWWMRHRIFSDGVSYLDIADNYLRGDWRHALNEYWSPLESWILALYFKLSHPPAYWQVAAFHAINLIAFSVSLVFLELFVAELLRYRPATAEGLSDRTIHLGAYAGLLIAGLWDITMGYVSPDMITMAILIFIAYLQLRIERGRAGARVYFLFGAALGLGFLSRAAFAPILPIYVAAMAGSLRLRQRKVLKPLLLVCSAALLLCGPFVLALSVVKGRFTWGATGPPNYAWEVDGAPRSVHWQGQPPELGKPRHPTRKVFNHPATYEFAGPVPGTYPPWDEPSYWYEGIRPRFYWDRQFGELRKSVPYLVALFLLSPVALPCLALILAGDWRVWMSRRGILAFWFLWLPVVAYAGLYTLVFMDKRYIGGALVIAWTCLSASISIPGPRLRHFANRALQVFCVLAAVLLVSLRMRPAIAVTLTDLVHHRESEWNLHWVLAQRFRELGMKAGDRIAYIGNAIDSEWARELGVRIVIEVPVIVERDNALKQNIVLNYREPDLFWHASSPVQARVLEAFRRAGASFVVTDRLPPSAVAQGWSRVLPPGTTHLPHDGSQYEELVKAGYLKIAP